MIGIVLGNRYEILEEIGKGGMAHVYKAKCNLLNRPVAVKVLRQDLEEDSEFLKRFNTEAQSAASLVHPNIVSIFDFGYDQGYHYIVMELIEGITLKQYIQENAPFSVKDALSVAYQICDALSAAHEKNIVHRDIKPHNIMITPDHRVKVTDFGIARVSSGSTMTADTNILGSVHYISPEQARGGHVDGKTDLYSLGIVLYEMLTGRIPFESDSPVAIAMKHIQETPVSPREYNPEISQSVENLILKSLSKNITDRYQNASDMKRDIMRLVENPDAEVGVKSPSGDVDTDDTMIISKTEILKAEEKMGQRSQQKPTVKKETSSSGENKKILISAILTAFIIVGSVSMFAAYVLFPEAAIFNIFQSEQVLVPGFVNMSLDEAKELAETENVEIEVKEEVEDSSVAEGIILEQSPNARKKVKPGTVVYVTVNVGAEKILIDDFKSSKFDVAEVVLQDLGFFVDVTYENSEDIPENYVIRQNPPAGQKAAKGSTVTLVVSKGPEETEVVVPRFVGKTYEQAKKDIENASLALGEVSYEESVIDKGLVIRQSVTGGETVNKGTSIDLVVSLGNNDKSEVGNHGSSHNNMVEKTLVSKINSDKEEVIVKVLEDGNKIYEGLFNPKAGSDFSLKVSGTGQKNYEVYVDGELVNTYTISFAE